MNGRNSSFCLVGREGPSSERQGRASVRSGGCLCSCHHTCVSLPKASELKSLTCAVRIHVAQPRTRRGSWQGRKPICCFRKLRFDLKKDQTLLYSLHGCAEVQVHTVSGNTSPALREDP